MKKEVVQYSVADLARSLLREYLTQKGLKQTLLTFEKEDTNNKKKINKNLLIEMVSLKNLFLLNKQSSDSQPTLLQILVAYLNKKYVQKNRDFQTTQPNFSYPKLLEIPQAQKDKKHMKTMDRPISSKPSKDNQIDMKKVNPPLRQKDQLKVIYQKIAKKDDSSKQFRIVESTLPKKNDPQRLQLKQNKKQEEVKVNTLHNNNTSQAEAEEEEQYNEFFEKEEQIQQKNSITPIEEFKVNKKEQVSNKIIQAKQLLIKQIVKPQIIQQKSSKANEQLPKKNISQKKIVISQKNIDKHIQQQNINPTPIVHIQSKPLQIINHQRNKQEMGCIQSNAIDDKKINAIKIQTAKNQPQPQKPLRNRTQMRVIKKDKESSKAIEELTESTKKEAPKQIKKQQTIIKEVKDQASTKILPSQFILEKKVTQQIKKVEEVAPPVMVTLGKKKKAKQEVNNQPNYPTKFKFDQNFTHQIPKEIVYQYKQYGFQPLTINESTSQLYPTVIINPQIIYKQKGGGVAPIKKKIQKIIPSKDAQRLKKIAFQSSPPTLPKAWTQGFILSPHEQTPYGLRQIEGGPCGIIAALQCYFLKHLLFCSKQTSYNDETLRQVCLVAAIANMLWKVKSTDKFILAFPPKGATKVQISNLRTVTLDANDFLIAFAGIWSYRDEYIGNINHGVASLLYSVVLTKGFDLIESQVDIKENPLIGNHGHCTQQFVNLILTGKATSNCFDGDKILDDYKLKGIPEKSQFGFLTIFEALKYIEVGKNLKNPIFPVWVICKQFHYHVIFAQNYLISQSNKCKKFDIVYFDGLYNCGDRIRITLDSLKQGEQDDVKLKDLPLIEQVMMTKWGRKVANWNGSTRIL